MPYGRIKVDNISFTDAGADKDISISGLVKNPTFTGNVTATGTISGDIIRGGTTVSGLTVTGTTANFTSGNFSTQVSGAVVKAPAGTAGTPSLQVGTGASVSPGLYGVNTDELGISTGGASRVVFDSTGQLRVVAGGSANAPALVVNNDIDTGIFSTAANEFAISTSGTEKLRFNASGAIGISGANYGTSGQVLASNGPSGAPSWQTAAAVNVQQFTSNGTWTKPAGTSYVLVELWGGGGGGQRGDRASVGLSRKGGGGGGGGAYIDRTFIATGLTSTVSVTVGAGGAGGAAATVDNTLDGGVGTSGGTSSFGSYISASGGAGGSGNTGGRGGYIISGSFGASNLYDGGLGNNGGTTTTGGDSVNAHSFFGGCGGNGGSTVSNNNQNDGYILSGFASLNGRAGRGGISRELNTLSNNGVKRCLTYGNGVYLMVAQSGWLITSSNLSTWTVYQTNFVLVYSIIHDGTKWVTLATDINETGIGVYTSTDLAAWTRQSTVTNASKIAHNSGTYVIVGTAGYLASSTDLITWTTRVVSGATTLYDIVYDNTRWVAAGSAGASGFVYTSTDAATWTARGGVASAAFYRIASNGAPGSLVAAAANTNIYYSTNTGTTWTGVTVSGDAIQGYIGLTWAAVESKFVRAVSGFINSSADGITWTNRASGATYWEDVIHNGTDFFAAATATGTTATGTTIIGNGSTDGITWSGSLTWSAYASSGEAGQNGSGLSAGGGGGGSSPNGFNSGAGGNGADGYVRVTSW